MELDMESVLSLAIYIIIIGGFILRIVKKNSKSYAPKKTEEGVSKGYKADKATAMPHVHRESGVYDTYNKKKKDNSTGAVPHSHNKEKYVSMADASHLPPGFILLNGEPVRVADLENK